MRKITELIPKGLSCSSHIEINGEGIMKNFYINLDCPFLVTNLENGIIIKRCLLNKKVIPYSNSGAYLEKQCDINIPTLEDIENIIFIE